MYFMGFAAKPSFSLVDSFAFIDAMSFLVLSFLFTVIIPALWRKSSSPSIMETKGLDINLGVLSSMLLVTESTL